MRDIKSHLRESKAQEVQNALNEIQESLYNEGYEVEFGRIGDRTTYALLTDKKRDIEIVGYTFIKDMKYYNENSGKLRALQQAVARKEIAESGSRE